MLNDSSVNVWDTTVPHLAGLDRRGSFEQHQAISKRRRTRRKAPKARTGAPRGPAATAAQEVGVTSTPVPEAASTSLPKRHSNPKQPRQRASAKRGTGVHILLLAGLAAGAAILIGLALVKLEGDPHFWDADIYHGYAEKMTHGELPYRDFALEYPPGALLPFVLPALVTSTTNAYDAKFQALMVIMLALASALVVLSLARLGAATSRIALSLAAMWGGTLLLGPFISSRFDLYAASVTLAATCAILYRRRYLGPALLGISASTKMYAAVLIPLLVEAFATASAQPRLRPATEAHHGNGAQPVDVARDSSGSSAVGAVGRFSRAAPSVCRRRSGLPQLVNLMARA